MVRKLHTVPIPNKEYIDKHHNGAISKVYNLLNANTGRGEHVV